MTINKTTLSISLIAVFCSLLALFLGSNYVGNRTQTYFNAWFTNGSSIVFTTRSIGVGTTTPSVNLQVVNGTTTPLLAIGSAYTSTTTPGKICFWNGANFTKLSFASGSTTPTYATSTACN